MILRFLHLLSGGGHPLWPARPPSPRPRLNQPSQMSTVGPSIAMRRRAGRGRRFFAGSTTYSQNRRLHVGGLFDMAEFSVWRRTLRPRWQPRRRRARVHRYLSRPDTFIYTYPSLRRFVFEDDTDDDGDRRGDGSTTSTSSSSLSFSVLSRHSPPKCQRMARRHATGGFVARR